MTSPPGRDIFEKCHAFRRHHVARELGVYPYFRILSTSEGSRAMFEDRPVIMLGSNNYLGLTHHPEVIAAAKAAIDRFGAGCTGSRMLNGTLELHTMLEQELADFMGKESCLLWSTGFMSNSGPIGTLCTRKDIIFADREVHASLVDGILLSQARLIRFKHNDVADLAAKLENNADQPGKVILVDGVYSMTGELSPLRPISALAKQYGARMLVDEAHALGVLGDGGRGTCSHFGVTEEVDLISGTFSKTFASMGGFLACPLVVKDYLMHHCRQFMYTASLTPSVVATVLAALHVMRRHPELVAQVLANANWMRSELEGLGFNCLASESAVVPIVVGPLEQLLWFSQRLFEEGVFVNAVIPPAVPANACLIRTSYMATHLRKDLEEALEIFERVGVEVGVIGPNREAMARHWATMSL